MEFAPGQRWHSLTEPELGLGIVELVEGREVVISYPACEVVRRYGRESAPLARARLTGAKAPLRRSRRTGKTRPFPNTAPTKGACTA